MINASKYINTNCLFWGNAKLDFLSKDQREELCNKEFVNWVSFIYWGEDLALRYVDEMIKSSTNKEKWIEIYHEEFKHKTMISSWMLERDIIPDTRNSILTFADTQLKKINKEETSSSEKVEIIKNVQLFLEEALFISIKYRFNSIIDRDLRSILNIILKDEATHLTTGKKEILDLGGSKISLGEAVKNNIKHLFPIGLGKSLLTDSDFSKVVNLSSRISSDLVNDVLNSSNDLNYPIKILKSFQKIPSYNCIGCSPGRHDGLHLEPKRDDNLVYDNFTFPKRCEGFNNIVHGGYIAMALDELLCYAPILQNSHLPLTMNLNVNYLKPVSIGVEYLIKSRVTSQDGQVYKVEASIEKNGKTHASATANLFVPNHEKAKILLGTMADSSIIKELLYS